MFLPGGADPDEVAFYLLAWAERRLGAIVEEERTRIRVKVSSGKASGLLVELAAALMSGRRLEVFVETDEEGNALQFVFGLLPEGGGRPVRMWHHPGHRDDPTPYHIHESDGSRRSSEPMTFSEITKTIVAVRSPRRRPRTVGHRPSAPFTMSYTRSSTNS